MPLGKVIGQLVEFLRDCVVASFRLVVIDLTKIIWFFFTQEAQFRKKTSNRRLQLYVRRLQIT